MQQEKYDQNPGYEEAEEVEDEPHHPQEIAVHTTVVNVVITVVSEVMHHLTVQGSVAIVAGAN
jgi:hypothetical protein